MVADDENITFELRNETRVGDEITFILPGTMDSVTVKLTELINAKNDERVEKLAAGMGNSILIPRAWLGDQHADKFVPYVLAYKKKNRG